VQNALHTNAILLNCLYNSGKEEWGGKAVLRGIQVIISLMLILCLAAGAGCRAEVLSGAVREQNTVGETGIIIDNRTGEPIGGAAVSIPAEGIRTTTDDAGKFSLKIPEKAPLILSVNADGYKPFSATLDMNEARMTARESMKILIEKLNANALVLDSELHHLGDNSYSKRSANAGDFVADADGTSFFKEFSVDPTKTGRRALLKIGSVIGIDTVTAKKLGQSMVRGCASTPVKVILNSHVIGEITFNGDNKVFRIPEGLLRAGSNRLEIETGLNLQSELEGDPDYDDMEFMNVILEL
jgi:hypothetical protein